MSFYHKCQVCVANKKILTSPLTGYICIIANITNKTVNNSLIILHNGPISIQKHISADNHQYLVSILYFLSIKQLSMNVERKHCNVIACRNLWSKSCWQNLFLVLVVVMVSPQLSSENQHQVFSHLMAIVGPLVKWVIFYVVHGNSVCCTLCSVNWTDLPNLKS